MAVETPITDSGIAPSERRERYGLLLLALVSAFAVQGVASPGKVEQVVVAVLLSATLLLSLWAAEARPLFVRLALVVAVLVVAASVAASIAGSVESATTRLANLLLVVLAPPAIVLGVIRSLRKRQQVTIPAVFGVLCLYLLLGMGFAFIYGAIGRFHGSFFAQNVTATDSRCLYFSFITLTTVGYGDLTAASNLGHTLCSFEALIGQIYLVTVVSLIVGNLRRSPPSDLTLTAAIDPGLTGAGSLLDEVARIDRAVYEAVAATRTPRLDGAMRRLSTAANYSRLSIASSAVLVLAGGSRGRRAAGFGLASVTATSAAANLLVKPFSRRRRPDRAAQYVPSARQVPMPASRSFPSGHTAAAVAFATGVGQVLPLASVPLHSLSALVGYSRVHTGVHYPGDVLAGAVLGAVVADVTVSVLERRWPAP